MSQIKDFWVTPANPPDLDTAQPESHNSENCTNQTSLIEFLCSSLSILWKDWPKQMNATALNIDSGRFSLSGTCPHCGGYSAFIMVGQPHAVELTTTARRLYSVMRCQICLDFILGSVIHDVANQVVLYHKHYPLGRPNDTVDENVPKSIAGDFSEAMRCHWVK